MASLCIVTTFLTAKDGVKPTNWLHTLIYHPILHCTGPCFRNASLVCSSHPCEESAPGKKHHVCTRDKWWAKETLLCCLCLAWVWPIQAEDWLMLSRWSEGLNSILQEWVLPLSANPTNTVIILAAHLLLHSRDLWTCRERKIVMALAHGSPQFWSNFWLNSSLFACDARWRSTAFWKIEYLLVLCKFYHHLQS